MAMSVVENLIWNVPRRCRIDRCKRHISKRFSGDSRQVLPWEIPRGRTRGRNSKIVVLSYLGVVAIRIGVNVKTLSWRQPDRTKEGGSDENGLHA